MRRPRLRALLADGSDEVFLRDVWPDGLFVAHGPLERLADFGDDALPRDPARLLRAPARSVRVFYRATHGAPRQAVTDPATALRLHDDLGCSLCLTDVSLPGLKLWAAEIERELGLPEASTTFNVYVSASGGGLAMHYDATRKIVVQVLGEKRWRIAPNAHVKNPSVSYSGDPTEAPRTYDTTAGPWPERMLEGAETLTLRPGSVLFLPRGIWHDTLAGEASLSVSVTLAPPSWGRFVLDQLHARLERDPAWRESAVGLWTDGPPRERALGSLAARLEALAATVRSLEAGALAPPPLPPEGASAVERKAFGGWMRVRRGG